MVRGNKDNSVGQLPAGVGLEQLLARIEQHLAAIRQGEGVQVVEWLTLQQAADELQLSRDTIERLVHAGLLKAAEIRTPTSKGFRRRYRIRRSWLDDFLEVMARESAQQRRPERQQELDRGFTEFIK